MCTTAVNLLGASKVRSLVNKGIGTGNTRQGVGRAQGAKRGGIENDVCTGKPQSGIVKCIARNIGAGAPNAERTTITRSSPCKRIPADGCVVGVNRDQRIALSGCYTSCLTTRTTSRTGDLIAGKGNAGAGLNHAKLPGYI